MINAMLHSRTPGLQRRHLLTLLGAALLPPGAAAQTQRASAGASTTRIEYEALFGGAKVADVLLNFAASESEYHITLRFDPQIGSDRRYESRGLVLPSGLRPLSFRIFEEKSSAPRRAVDFDYKAGELRHGTEQVTRMPLVAGTQDVLSLPFHLARLRPKAEVVLGITRGGEPHENRISPLGPGRVQLATGAQAVERYQAVEGNNRMELSLLASEPRLPVQTGLVTKLGAVNLLALRVG
jgi:hypothetical protein